MNECVLGRVVLPDAHRDRVGETESGELAQVGMQGGRQEHSLAPPVP